MDNFGGIAILVLIWIVGAVFDKKKKEEKRRRQMAQQSLPPSIEIESVSAEPRSQLPDASQREGSKLEQVLRQLNPELAALADQALTQSRHEAAANPEPKVRSVTLRPPVEPVAAREDTDDFMAKAERAIARRRLTAVEYSRERTAQDHESFHQEARRPVESEVESLPAEAPSLKQAIVWGEILGPPRAMTIDEM
jgi:hypothetical protein